MSTAEPTSPSFAMGFFQKVTEPFRRLGDRFGEKGDKDDKDKGPSDDWDFALDLEGDVGKIDGEQWCMDDRAFIY